MNGRDIVILNKIYDYCQEIRKTHHFFAKNKDLFMDKEEGYIYRNSITMPILQIGELTKLLSDDFLNENKNIPWKMIMRMRDVVAHHYGSLDLEIVWNTSIDDIVDLEEEVSKYRKDF